MHIKKNPKPTHTQKEEISIKTPKEESNETLSTIIIKWSQCFCNLKHCFALVYFCFVPEMKLVTVDFKTNIRASAISIVFQTLYKLQPGDVFSFTDNVIPNIKDRINARHVAVFAIITR